MSEVLDRVVFDTEVSDRKILIVPIHTVHHTPYNPAARTKEGDKLRRLISEINGRGLIYPILITSDRDVIDGNRRLAACRALGHKTIECIVSDLDRDEAFTVVNTTAIAIGGKGWLEIGMGNGYMPPKMRQQYDELFGLIGTYGIKLLIDQNLGLNILPLCKQISALDAKYNLAQIVMVVAARRLTNKVNFVMRSGGDRESRVAAMDAVLAHT
jgi:ParB-like nuclease domain